MSDQRMHHDRRETADRRIDELIEKRHEARTADMRVIASRRKPRQTRAMFLQHVEHYCNGRKDRRR